MEPVGAREASSPKVAIVHYWLVGMRGGERVLESLCHLYPDAHIYTHVLDRERISSTLLRHQIFTTFISRLPFARRWYQRYLPFMPLALESLDLTAYDLVISSESGPAKGVITRPDALHVTYCHSPMRYIWDHSILYAAAAGRITRLLMGPVSHYMRVWDVTSAARTDLFLANSTFIRLRIRKFYRREALVVHPPVRIADFIPGTADAVGDFYLWVGELVPYKRPDLAVEAFSKMGKKLVIVGDGPERRRLELIAGPSIQFIGKSSFAELKSRLATCRALIFPGEEDFGIVPVEAQASGRPVIAFGRGGALDTVVDKVTGILFNEQTVAGLSAAVAQFEQLGMEHRCTDACRKNAERFDEEVFRRAFAAAIAGGGERHV